MGKTYTRENEDFKRLHVKEYDAEELEALNLYLQVRKSLSPEASHIGKIYYIWRDENDVDWMTKVGNGVCKKMFRLESWKRFNWGNKERRAK